VLMLFQNMARGITADVTVTVQTVRHIMDIVMVAGITVTIMCTAVSSVVTEAAAVWIKEQICLEERKRLLSRYMM